MCSPAIRSTRSIEHVHPAVLLASLQRSVPPCTTQRFHREWEARADVWRRVAMDPKLLRTLSELQARSGSDRGIQWEVHVQPVCLAWWLLRYLPFAYTVHLPQLLSGQRPMAIHGHPLSQGGVTSKSLGRAHSGSTTLNRSGRPFAMRCCKGCKMLEKNCRVSTSTMTSVRSCSSRFVSWTSTTSHVLSWASCRRTCRR